MFSFENVNCSTSTPTFYLFLQDYLFLLIGRGLGSKRSYKVNNCNNLPRGKVDVLAPQLCTIQSRRLEVLVTLLQRDNVIPTNLLLVELRNKGRSLLLKSSFEM